MVCLMISILNSSKLVCCLKIMPFIQIQDLLNSECWLMTLVKYIVIFDLILLNLIERSYWHYGNDKCSGDCWHNIGSVMIYGVNMRDSTIGIRRLMLDGFSHWAEGQWLPREDDIQHLDDHAVKLTSRSWDGLYSHGWSQYAQICSLEYFS